MPYKVKGNCVYKKDTNTKVGCTKGDVNKYLAALHANVDEEELVGGKGDDKTANDIAKKFDVPVEKIKQQIKKGTDVEGEHTGNKNKAKEIATDHETEMPDYYDKLEKMEKKETNETKILIKRMLRENLEEGPFTRALGTAAMAASTLLPPNVQAQKSSELPKIEKSSEIAGSVVKQTDGSYISTARGIAPEVKFAYDMGVTNAQDQILGKLGIEKGNLANVSVISKKITKNKNGTYTALITISATLK